MGTTGFKYSWRQIEAAVEGSAEWRQVVCDQCSTKSNKP